MVFSICIQRTQKRQTIKLITIKKTDLIFEKLKENYTDYRVAVFSDHGMTTLIDTLDIQAKLKETKLSEPDDYISFLTPQWLDSGIVQR